LKNLGDPSRALSEGIPLEILSLGIEAFEAINVVLVLGPPDSIEVYVCPWPYTAFSLSSGNGELRVVVMVLFASSASVTGMKILGLV